MNALLHLLQHQELRSRIKIVLVYTLLNILQGPSRPLEACQTGPDISGSGCISSKKTWILSETQLHHGIIAQLDLTLCPKHDSGFPSRSGLFRREGRPNEKKPSRSRGKVENVEELPCISTTAIPVRTKATWPTARSSVLHSTMGNGL
jgi:hypothetical protein